MSSLRPASGLRTTLAGWPGGRERSLPNRGLCCEDEISNAAPDPGGKELLAWGVNELRRPRGCRGAATVTERVSHDARFALAKFRPTTLPTTLLTRPTLLGQLEAGASQRLTVVVGSAGAGKSVLLSSWAATRHGGVTSWLSCDEADADPVRFWRGSSRRLRLWRRGSVPMRLSCSRWMA